MNEFNTETNIVGEQLSELSLCTLISILKQLQLLLYCYIRDAM